MDIDKIDFDDPEWREGRQWYEIRGGEVPGEMRVSPHFQDAMDAAGVKQELGYSLNRSGIGSCS
jgi:hypothetical protein